MLNTKEINMWLSSLNIDLGNFDGTDLDLELTEIIRAQSKDFLSENPDEEFEKAIMIEYINEYEYRKNRESRDYRKNLKNRQELRKEVEYAE